jgi:hypothetical protein
MFTTPSRSGPSSHSSWDEAHRRPRAPVLLGAALVFLCFPKKEEEEQLLMRYHTEDTARPTRPDDAEETTVGIPTPSS